MGGLHGRKTEAASNYFTDYFRIAGAKPGEKLDLGGRGEDYKEDMLFQDQSGKERKASLKKYFKGDKLTIPAGPDFEADKKKLLLAFIGQMKTDGQAGTGLSHRFSGGQGHWAMGAAGEGGGVLFDEAKLIKQFGSGTEEAITAVLMRMALQFARQENTGGTNQSTQFARAGELAGAVQTDLALDTNAIKGHTDAFDVNARAARDAATAVNGSTTAYQALEKAAGGVSTPGSAQALIGQERRLVGETAKQDAAARIATMGLTGTGNQPVSVRRPPYCSFHGRRHRGLGIHRKASSATPSISSTRKPSAQI